MAFLDKIQEINENYKIQSNFYKLNHYYLEKKTSTYRNFK